MSDWFVVPLPTELHKASKVGDVDLVGQLLRSGADVNETDASGNTALIFASANGHYRTAKKLVEMGAKLTHVNKEYGGKTALFYARESGTLQIENYLVQAELEQRQTDMKHSTSISGGGKVGSGSSGKPTNTISNAEKMAERRKIKLAAAGTTVVASSSSGQGGSRSPAEVEAETEAWFASNPEYKTPRGENTVSLVTCSTCGGMFGTPSKLFQHQGPTSQGKSCVVVAQEGSSVENKTFGSFFNRSKKKRPSQRKSTRSESEASGEIA